MNPTAWSQYLDLFIKFCNAVSVAMPIVAILLRGLGLMKKAGEPEPERFLPIVGFGVVGGILGLALGVVFTLIGIFEIGLHVYAGVLQQSANGMFPINLPDLPVSSIVLGIGGLVTTLLTFGGKNKMRGFSFVMGTILGGTIGTLIMLMIAVSMLGH